MTALIILLAGTFFMSIIVALGSESAARNRAGTILTVWSLVLLTGLVVVSKTVGW